MLFIAVKFVVIFKTEIKNKPNKKTFPNHSI